MRETEEGLMDNSIKETRGVERRVRKRESGRPGGVAEGYGEIG